MDDTQFDELTRALGGMTSRRHALRAATAGGLVGAVGLLGRDAAAKKKTNRKKPKGKCGKRCCANGQSCIAGACATACSFTKTAML